MTNEKNMNDEGMVVRFLSVRMDDSDSAIKRVTIEVDYDGLPETWTIYADKPFSTDEFTSFKRVLEGLNVTHVEGAVRDAMVKAWEWACGDYPMAIAVDSDIEHQAWRCDGMGFGGFNE